VPGFSRALGTPSPRRERSAFRYPSHSFPSAGLLLSYKGVRESVRWSTRHVRLVGCMMLSLYRASRIEFPLPLCVLARRPTSHSHILPPSRAVKGVMRHKVLRDTYTLLQRLIH
jgi:hypothetical protein